MRIVFMGTPDFSVPVLEALVDAGHEIVAVYSQPPRPAGRGKKDRPSPVQSKAEALGLMVRYPQSVRTERGPCRFCSAGSRCRSCRGIWFDPAPIHFGCAQKRVSEYSRKPFAALAWGGTNSPRHYGW